MKKRIFYLIFGMVACLTFCSCGSVTYFYSTIDSAGNSLQLQDTGEFLYEDDTLSIAYNFSGYDIPIRVSIYNKLDESLFLDWDESALVVEGESMSLANTTTDYQGSIDAYDNFEGKINHSPQTLFIPPQSRAKIQLATVTDPALREINDSELESLQIVNKDLKMISVKVRNYSVDDSPLYFTTYLTFYTSDANRREKDYFSISQNFYISEILKTSKIQPDKLNSNYRDKGNVCYTYNPIAISTFGAIVGVVGLIGIGVAIEALWDIPASEPFY